MRSLEEGARTSRQKQPVRWFAETSGAICTIKEVRYRQYVAAKKPRKGISKFTRASRLRMLSMLATIRWDDVPESSFLTVTYPDPNVHTDSQKRNQERYLLHRMIERFAGITVPTMWRVEWKERLTGANVGEVLPHIHMLAFGGRYVGRERLRSWWRSIIKAEGRLEVDSQIVSAGDTVGLYISKYCGKVEDVSSSLDNGAYLNTGRQWGVLRKSRLPIYEKQMVEVRSAELLGWLRGLASSVLPNYDPDWGGSFRLLGSIGSAANLKILGELIDVKDD